MNSYAWFKLYSKSFEDIKLRALSDSAFRVWFQLLCLANVGEERGTITIDSEPLFAMQVGKSIGEINEAIKELCALNLIIQPVENSIVFENWGRYQEDVKKRQTRERVAKHRQKQKESEALTSNDDECNADVTQEERYSNAKCNAKSVTVTHRSRSRSRKEADIEAEHSNGERQEMLSLVENFLSDARLQGNAQEFIKAIEGAIPDGRVLSLEKLADYFAKHLSRPKRVRHFRAFTSGGILDMDSYLFSDEKPAPPCTNPACENGMVFEGEMAYKCPDCNGG